MSPAAPRQIGRVELVPGAVQVLLPGQFGFGGQCSELRTLLGSCVGITLWHPQRRLGGMCHFLLPSRRRRPDDPLDARFGDEAMLMLAEAMARHGTRPQDYVAHLYGGADTMPDAVARCNIGERNIAGAWALIDRHGFALDGVDVGETMPRTVVLRFPSGDVQMRRGRGRAETVAP